MVSDSTGINFLTSRRLKVYIHLRTREHNIFSASGRLGRGKNPPAPRVGRCVEGRYGIEYFTERDKNKNQQNEP
jgi:hypothetical protein